MLYTLNEYVLSQRSWNSKTSKRCKPQKISSHEFTEYLSGSNISQRLYRWNTMTWIFFQKSQFKIVKNIGNNLWNEPLYWLMAAITTAAHLWFNWDGQGHMRAGKSTPVWEVTPRCLISTLQQSHSWAYWLITVITRYLRRAAESTKPPYQWW